MSEEDRATRGRAEGAAGQVPATGGYPAGGGRAERGGSQVAVPAETAVLPPAQPGNRGGPGGRDGPGGPPRPGPPRGKTVPRPLFYAILSLLLVALLAIAGLVVTRPKAGTALAVRSPSAGGSSPAANDSASSSSSASPSPSAGGTGAAGTGSASASASPAASAAPPATTGTNLFTQSPVQANDATVTDGAVQIGNTSYPDSVRFTCETGVYSATSLVYDVAGFSFLNASLGVPSNATNVAGNTMNITFFKDGSTDQLGKTITVSLDSPVSLHVNLDGASQVAIDCAATHSATDAPVPMDIAFGNAVLTPS